MNIIHPVSQFILQSLVLKQRCGSQEELSEIGLWSVGRKEASCLLRPSHASNKKMHSVDSGDCHILEHWEVKCRPNPALHSHAWMIMPPALLLSGTLRRGSKVTLKDEIPQDDRPAMVLCPFEAFGQLPGTICFTVATINISPSVASCHNGHCPPLCACKAVLQDGTKLVSFCAHNGTQTMQQL